MQKEKDCKKNERKRKILGIIPVAQLVKQDVNNNSITGLIPISESESELFVFAKNIYTYSEINLVWLKIIYICTMAKSVC